MAVDWNGSIDEGVQAAKGTYHALVSLATDNGVPPFLAQGIAFFVAALVAIGRVLYIIVLFSFVSLGTTLVTAVLQVIKAIRQDGAADFAAVTGEALGEFMAIDTAEVDFAVGKDAASSLKRAQQLGDVFLTMMQGQFGNGGVQSPDDGEKAAKALAGYGINFATSNTFLSWMIELGTDGKFGDFDKLGEDVAAAVGLGRLTRRALQPLVRNAISHPYDRKMRALYRPDILSAPELVKEFLAGRMTEDQCDAFLAQHGFADDLIAAIKAQHTPSLHSAEIEELIALGAIDAVSGSGQLKQQGLPDSIVSWQLQLHTRKRLAHLRDRILSEVLTQINQGFADPSDIEKWFTQLSIPQDEAQMWRQAAGLAAERTRKRLSHGDMLFLYEAAQITDVDVEAWARDEGYTENDVQQLLTVFRLKAAAAATTKTGGTAARTAHLHKEHIAYVTDEITGLWGRSPTAAELNYWVQLIDTGERTKHDFLTELKALDTSGPAIPSA